MSQPPPPPPLHTQRTAQTTASFLLPTISALSSNNPNLSLLDVGCGSGSITHSFATLYPSFLITGLDPSLPSLTHARSLPSTSNLSFISGDIFSLPFPDNSFDVVFCHQVLVHLPTPWEGIREMLRVTKIGGVVGIREGDYESEVFWPRSEGLERFHGLMAGCMEAGGGSKRAGRELVSWAMRAGVEREKIAFVMGSTGYFSKEERGVCAQTLCTQLRGGGMKAKALKFGLGGEDDFEGMAKALEEWAKMEDAGLAMLQGEMIIRK